MAIRIRVVNGVTVALCAARSVPKEGDVYLDDAHHYALGIKFRRDHAQMDGLPLPYADALEHAIIDAEESNNPNRLIWDETYTEVIMPYGEKQTFEKSDSALIELDAINEAQIENNNAFRLYREHVFDLARINAQYPAKQNYGKRPANKSLLGRLWNWINS